MDIFVGQDAESLGLPMKLQGNKKSRCTFKYEFCSLICPTISCHAPKHFFCPLRTMSLSSYKFHAMVGLQLKNKTTNPNLSSYDDMLHTSTICHDVMKKCVVQICAMKICQQHRQTLSCAWQAELLLPLHIRHDVFQSIKHV